MADDLADEAKRKIVGRSPDWIRRFEVGDYINNRPMIEKLHEEKQLAFAEKLGLERKVSDLSDRLHQRDLDNQSLTLELKNSRKQSFAIFVVALLATILAGIGINLITDEPGKWTGWTMLIAAVILELGAFMLAIRNR